MEDTVQAPAPCIRSRRSEFVLCWPPSLSFSCPPPLSSPLLLPLFIIESNGVVFSLLSIYLNLPFCRAGLYDGSSRRFPCKDRTRSSPPSPPLLSTTLLAMKGCLLDRWESCRAVSFFYLPFSTLSTPSLFTLSNAGNDSRLTEPFPPARPPPRSCSGCLLTLIKRGHTDDLPSCSHVRHLAGIHLVPLTTRY